MLPTFMYKYNEFLWRREKCLNRDSQPFHFNKTWNPDMTNDPKNWQNMTIYITIDIQWKKEHHVSQKKNK